jgi:hypothetical protein
VFRLFFL